MYINESPYLPTIIPSLIIYPDLFIKNIPHNKNIIFFNFYKIYLDI